MKTHDGASKALGPIPGKLGAGAVICVLGVGVSVAVWWLAGLPILFVGALVLLDGTGGTHRVRVTPTKVVIEDDTRVRGFLIGPHKRRFAYGELSGAEVRDGALWLQSGGESVAVLEGNPPDELESVKARIDRASEAFAKGEAI